LCEERDETANKCRTIGRNKAEEDNNAYERQDNADNIEFAFRRELFPPGKRTRRGGACLEELLAREVSPFGGRALPADFVVFFGGAEGLSSGIFTTEYTESTEKVLNLCALRGLPGLSVQDRL